MSKRLFTKIKPAFFTPKYRVSQDRQSNSYANTNKSFCDDEETNNILKNTNFESTSSYRYQNKIGVVSTQEMNIDYDFFENHTFFHSAVSKVNEAFDTIVNHYPFDGNLKEIEAFEDGLTGYEKHILDKFPKNVGYLNFSGSNILANGTQINVKDREGVSIASLSKSKTGASKIDPYYKPITFQMYIKIPEEVNDNQIIVQKRSGLAENITLCLSESSSTSTCKLMFGIQSGSNHIGISTQISKGSFSHVTAMYDRKTDKKLKLLIFDNNNNKKILSSSNAIEFGNLNYKGNDLTIGNGQEVRIENELFTPVQTFSGSIDDFKVFHRSFDEKYVKSTKDYTENKYSDLALYFKFNEPFGDYNGNNTILDSSGNSLNSLITNFGIESRNTGSDAPVLGEDISRSPVLFPNFNKVLNLNTSLINSASVYDEVNPNLITRFVPRHYFDEGNLQDNFSSPLGNIATDFNKVGSVRNNINKVSSAQILTKFLLTWAKFFDEIKIFIDNFSLLTHVNYQEKNTIANKFLYDLGKRYGIELPNLFSNSNDDQLFYGKSTSFTPERIVRSLLELQNLIWRNILTNMPQIIKKKGTIHAIENIFRASGIEPRNIFRIREYGGAKIRSLENSFEEKKDVISFLSFSGSINHLNESVDSQGVSSTSPILKSKFLSGSRIEIGQPKIRGAFVNKTIQNPHGVSNNISDGLLTSGSFTYQGTYRFPKQIKHNNYQSLIRLHVTGTANPSSNEAAYLNLVADKENNRIDLFFVDNATSTSVNNLFVTGVNVFDSDPWAISFGRANSTRIDAINNSLYFLRVGKFNQGKKIAMFSTASYFTDQGNNSITENITSTYNSSGSFLVVGSQSLNPGSGAGKFLNNGTLIQKSTIFSGDVSSINFWSKFNTITDFERYGKDVLSVGSEKPLKNYNYNTLETGSYGRLRLQTFAKQGMTGSADGSIVLFDITKNAFHIDGTGFEQNKNLMKPHYVIREMLDYDFDINTTNEKVRIRSFKDINKAKSFRYATTTPVYEVRKSEEVFDDSRFSIDLSVMKGLNENIMRIFSNMNFFDNALGKPNIMFSNYYRDYIAMRRMYFNNVLEKIDLEKYRSLFKWIDNAYTDLVFSFIPRTTNFLGINFIYESHVLERHRIKYLYDKMYCKSLPPERQEKIPERPIDVPVGTSTDDHDRGEGDQPTNQDFQVFEHEDDQRRRENNNTYDESKDTVDPSSRLSRRPHRILYVEQQDNSDSATIAGQSNAPERSMDPRGKVEQQEEEKKESLFKRDIERHSEIHISPSDEILNKGNDRPAGESLNEVIRYRNSDEYTNSNEERYIPDDLNYGGNMQTIVSILNDYDANNDSSFRKLPEIYNYADIYENEDAIDSIENSESSDSPSSPFNGT